MEREERDRMDQFKNLGDTLTVLRKNRNIHQSQLAAMLEERGIKVTNQAISKWENGKTIPNAVQFLTLCDVLGVEDVMSCFSDGHTGFLSGLNPEGRKMITELIHVMSESSKYAQR